MRLSKASCELFCYKLTDKMPYYPFIIIFRADIYFNKEKSIQSSSIKTDFVSKVFFIKCHLTELIPTGGACYDFQLSLILANSVENIITDKLLQRSREKFASR